METKSALDTINVSHQFAELIHDLILLRPRLILPEQMTRFREQMERLKCGNISEKDDFHAILRIFIILSHADPPPTMGELSSQMSVPFSTATRVVDWLVQGNFVERLPDPNDRRLIRVSMTPTGEEIYRISMDFMQQRIRYLLEYFTPVEQAELYRLLSKLLTAFKDKESQSFS